MTDSAPDTHGLQDQPDPPALAAYGRIVYVVHPGYVRSMNDRDHHRIGFARLCRLYGLTANLPDVFNADDHGTAGAVFRLERQGAEIRHLYPSVTGDYYDATEAVHAT